jgi:prolipoprotein diacylglyceryltransferase
MLASTKPGYRWGNVLLDRIATPIFVVRGRIVPSWNVFVGAGVAAGSAVFLFAGRHAGLAWSWLAALVVLNAVAFLVHCRCNIWLARPPRLVLLRHVVVNLLATFAAAEIAALPVLPVLDAWSIGMALLLAFGRLGCLAMGCCHGRTAGFGPKYPWRPVADRRNFDPEMRFSPVQACESLCLLALCAAGIAILESPHQPGDATVLFLSGYGIARFGLETLRGDWRHYLGRLSEAQWCSVVLVAAALGAAWAAQPWRRALWFPAAAAAAICLMVEAGIAIISGTLRKPASQSRALPRDRP